MFRFASVMNLSNSRYSSRLLSVIILFMFFSVNLSAQETDTGYTLSPMEKLAIHIMKEFDLEGIDLFYPMNKQQVIEKFGEPDRYSTYYSEESDYTEERYDYGGNYLRFVDGCLLGFDLNTPRWTVFNRLVDGGCKVGDLFSVLSELNPQKVDWAGVSDLYYLPCGDFPLYIKVENVIITSIYYDFRIE